MDKLGLSEIAATSPTLAEVMRACFLRAGLSRVSASSRFVLGSPKAWLGSAYHKVLENVAHVNSERETLAVAVERLWDEAIASQYDRSCRHPLDRRFGPPTTWPGYYLARASVHLRAQEIAAASRRPASGEFDQNVRSAEGPPTLREQDLTAYGGKLVGRPDVIRGSEIIDYKSGEIVEYDEDGHPEALKSAYVRQLRIYGYLVKEALGWTPARGLLLPVVGAGVEVALEPAECEREASEAVAVLDAYNAQVRGQISPAELATPSPSVCKWCPYKLFCPAFWQKASPAWSGQLDGGCIEGTVAEPPLPIHGGAAIAVPVDIQSGTEAQRRAQITPLDLTVHQAAGRLTPGDRVRLTGLRVRPDGLLLPTKRTVLADVEEVPDVALSR